MGNSIFDRLRLDGKTAFVTGAARGIGYRIAEVLAEAGADVAIVDIDYDGAVVAAAKLGETSGRKLIAMQADLTKEEQTQSMVTELIRQFGRLDIAVNNAGICLNRPALEHSFSDWKKVMAVNLDAVFLCSVAAAKEMLKTGDGGSIINIASMSGHIVNVPQPQASYNASKAAVIQLTKSLAVEWAEHRIRVNSISPGYIGTDLTLASKDLKPLIPGWEATIPMRRLGRPDELQGIALYLAGDASAYTTGSDFIVDGGFTSI